MHHVKQVSMTGKTGFKRLLSSLHTHCIFLLNVEECRIEFPASRSTVHAMWKLDELHLGLSSYSRHAALHHVSPRRHVTTACNGMARPHVAIVGAGAAGLAAGHETLNQDDESFFKVSWDRNIFLDIFCWWLLFYKTWPTFLFRCHSDI